MGIKKESAGAWQYEPLYKRRRQTLDAHDPKRTEPDYTMQIWLENGP